MKIYRVACMVALLLFAPLSAQADTVKITVKGMVCSFCAQGIKRTISGKPGVESVDVNLETKMVTVVTKKGAVVSDAELSQNIVDSGFEVITIERAPDA